MHVQVNKISKTTSINIVAQTNLWFLKFQIEQHSKIPQSCIHKFKTLDEHETHKISKHIVLKSWFQHAHTFRKYIIMLKMEETFYQTCPAHSKAFPHILACTDSPPHYKWHATHSYSILPRSSKNYIKNQLFQKTQFRMRKSKEPITHLISHENKCSTGASVP